jgi:uncharacterized membrane protein YjgN (DUF898 family)
MTVVDASAAATPPVPAVRFVGDRRAYWRLLVRGNALLAVTLGIYRFWFATDVRRYLWSNTEVAGESLEYTGTAVELLIGFLIAIAILIPLYLALAIAALSLGRLGQLASVMSFPLLFFLGQFAVYRARRYRLTRTVYRGVRFHQGGSALRYAVCASFWWILMLLTLGLGYPFAQSRLERFKMRQTYYGNLTGRFESSGLRLFAHGLPMWLLVMGPLLFALIYSLITVEWTKVVGAAKSTTTMPDFINQLDSEYSTFYSAVVVSLVAIAISVTMAAILFPIFQAMVLRWWISGLRIGTLTIHSRLRTAQIYGAYLHFLAYALLFLVVIAIVGGLAAYLLGAVLSSVKTSIATELAKGITGIGIYVATMLGISAIYQGTVKLALWRVGMESVELEGVAALDHVRADGVPSSAVGEGLADALNVGGF